MNRKAGMFLDILPLFLIFIVGTTMILAIGFFILKAFSEASTITGYTILGTSCSGESCKGINAGIMGLIIIVLILFQYLFYKRYHKKRREILTKS